jgi:hypothetical protein
MRAWPGRRARAVAGWKQSATLARRSRGASMRGQQATAWRRLLALAVLTVAVVAIVLEPFPKGAVLLSLSHSHGVDAGDLPAIVLLLVGGWLAR